MTIRLIHVGLGGFGLDWERRRLPMVPEVERVACVDSVPSMLTRAQERIGVRPEDSFASLADAMAERMADAVLITAPVDGHVPLAIEAMRAGLHVITEKPFAANLAEAKEAIAVAEETGRILMVSQNYRCQPAARTAAALIADRTLGDLGAVRVDFRKWANDKPDGHKHFRLRHPLLYDMAIHHFDLMRFITGREARTVFTQITDPPWSRFVEEASATVTVTFDDDLVVSYRGSWVSPGEPTTWSGDWHLECEDGDIYWTGRSGEDDAPHEVVRIRRRTDPEITETPELVEVPRPGRAGQLTALVEAIKNGQEPDTSGRRNLGTLALMEAAARSAASGQVEQVEL